jgi:hypothetical protein
VNRFDESLVRIEEPSNAHAITMISKRTILLFLYPIWRVALVDGLRHPSANSRTPDLSQFFWKKTAYLIEMERETGIEPATSSLGSWRSTAELLPPG